MNAALFCQIFNDLILPFGKTSRISAILNVSDTWEMLLRSACWESRHPPGGLLISRYTDLLLICGLPCNKHACFLAQPTWFPLHNRYTTDGRQVRISSVGCPSPFLFVFLLSLCSQLFPVSEGYLAKLDKNRRAVGNRLGDKNKAVTEAHMRPRLFQELESKSEVKPPRTHVIGLF